MEVDEEDFEVPTSSSKGEKKRFDVKKVSTDISFSSFTVNKKYTFFNL